MMMLKTKSISIAAGESKVVMTLVRISILPSRTRHAQGLDLKSVLLQFSATVQCYSSVQCRDQGLRNQRQGLG